MKLPTGLGNVIEVEASRPLDAYVDGPRMRIRFGTTLPDASELHLWLTAQQFQQSLFLFRRCAQQLGIAWPGETAPPAPAAPPKGSH